MSDLLKVSSNPHVRSRVSTSSIMLTVVLALMPSACFGIWHFGYRAAIIILITVATCVLSELLFDIICKKPITIKDFSAVVTGLLLAMNLPSTVPYWLPVIGGVFAIVVVKMLFGGLGQNFMNPALGARCFLLLSFASLMTNFNYDGMTSSTPLAVIKSGGEVKVLDMIIGNTAGTIGETSVIAIAIGACILLIAGIIDLRIPVAYIASFAIFIFIFSGEGVNYTYIAAELSGGGLMLGAFFMATDYATRPITKRGQLVFGIFLGIMTGIFRLFGASAEGVSYAIILGNLIVPLIEKITKPVPFGGKVGK